MLLMLQTQKVSPLSIAFHQRVTGVWSTPRKHLQSCTQASLDFKMISIHLVGGLSHICVNGKDYPIYYHILWKIKNVPNHQPDMFSPSESFLHSNRSPGRSSLRAPLLPVARLHHEGVFWPSLNCE